MIGQLIGPKAATGLVAIGVATTVDLKFGQSISVGAILIAALVVVLGGFFTLRNNMKTFWKDLAHERKEQIDVLEAEVREAATKLLDLQHAHSEEMLAFAAEQREIRHGLKTTNADLVHKLALEVAKHDLSAVTERLKALEELAITRGAMFDRIDHNEERQIDLLTVIVKHLVPDYEEEAPA